MKEIIVKSSCLFMQHPAHHIHGSGDYMEISVREVGTEEEICLFRGDKFNKEEYEEKLAQEKGA